jgi:hypothetical protein
MSLASLSSSFGDGGTSMIEKTPAFWNRSRFLHH